MRASSWSPRSSPIVGRNGSVNCVTKNVSDSYECTGVNLSMKWDLRGTRCGKVVPPWPSDTFASDRPKGRLRIHHLTQNMHINMHIQVLVTCESVWYLC